MCNTTKQRIADALRQLMNEKPFDKITVRNLMDATNMKRQSFYYHFQDTRDVLMWICRQSLLDPLAASGLEFTDWVLLALELLAEDRSFYRKLIAAARPHFVSELEERVLRPRMEDLLYPGTLAHALDANQRFAVDFAVQAVTNRLVRFVGSREALEPAQMRQRVAYLLDTFGIRNGKI